MTNRLGKKGTKEAAIGEGLKAALPRTQATLPYVPLPARNRDAAEHLNDRKQAPAYGLTVGGLYNDARPPPVYGSSHKKTCHCEETVRGGNSFPFSYGDVYL